MEFIHMFIIIIYKNQWFFLYWYFFYSIWKNLIILIPGDLLNNQHKKDYSYQCKQTAKRYNDKINKINSKVPEDSAVGAANYTFPFLLCWTAGVGW